MKALSLLAPLLLLVPPVSAAAKSPIVSTIAGSGTPGLASGPALAASFTEPSGVAVALDGTIYVADAGSHQILKIRGGSVERVAGKSSPGLVPGTYTGGYVDGPAATAQFNRPLGVAVARDGTLFVADSQNYCIRKIQHGNVSTLAGTVRRGKEDGTGQAASFNMPMAIAIDDDGYLYVADFGNGIRKIAPDGTVTTVSLREDSRKVLAVAVRGSGRNFAMAYTDTDSVHLSVAGGGGRLKADEWREPYGEGLTIGFSYGVTIVGPDAVVVTDLLDNAVRFVRFGSLAVQDTHTLAGGLREGATAPIGGYRDGPSDVALVDVPLGVARAPDGTLIVADTGNRRIRKISELDPRGPVLQGFAGLVGPKNSYRIVMLGNSYTWSSVMWPDSIPGQVEAGLLQNGQSFGLKNKPFVALARLNTVSVSGLRSVVQNYLADGEADLVILFLNIFTQAQELDQRPELKKDDLWRTVVPQELRQLDAALKAQHTKLLVVCMPWARDVSILEAPKFYADVNGVLFDPNDRAKSDAEIEGVYLASGVKTISLTREMRTAELSSNRVPFFQTADPHMTSQGETWVGQAVLRELERWKPWADR